MVYMPLFDGHGPSRIVAKNQGRKLINYGLSLPDRSNFFFFLNSNCQGNGQCFLDAMSQVSIDVNFPGSRTCKCLYDALSINDISRYH